LPSASPVFIFPLSPQAENLLCRLQENFEALTEKLTLRNILFGMWQMGERINDLENRVAGLMTEAGVENSDEELEV
ncbi:HSBPL protein, partial [Pheucticus melanocephalus]|nr:HSBPL protein [Pheucticus melanocephalus]